MGNTLYFVAATLTPSPGLELWKSNGTVRGTAPLTHFSSGSRLFFRSNDHATGEELWALDSP